MTRCVAKTAAGTRCKLRAKAGKTHCGMHYTRSRPTKIAGPQQMFRAGRLDPNSPISKLDVFTMNKIVGPLKKKPDLEAYSEAIKACEKQIKMLDRTIFIGGTHSNAAVEARQRLVNTKRAHLMYLKGRLAALKKAME